MRAIMGELLFLAMESRIAVYGYRRSDAGTRLNAVEK